MLRRSLFRLISATGKFIQFQVSNLIESYSIKYPANKPLEGQIMMAEDDNGQMVWTDVITQILTELDSIKADIEELKTGVPDMTTEQILNAIASLDTKITAITSSIASLIGKADEILGDLGVIDGKLNQSSIPVLNPVSGSFTVSQSSSIVVGTVENLTDGVSQSGAGTNQGTTSWIQIDYGSPVEAKAVRLGGGNMANWGVISPYLNGHRVMVSNNGTDFVSVADISGIIDTGVSVIRTFVFPQPVTARYWRIQGSGYVATSEFRLMA